MTVFNEILVMIGLSAGLFSFILNNSHLLNSLLTLEFMGVMIYWLISGSIFSGGGDFFFTMFYLVMMVCEGVLGLSVLIGCVYSHGSDYMKSYSSLVC